MPPINEFDQELYMHSIRFLAVWLSQVQIMRSFVRQHFRLLEEFHIRLRLPLPPMASDSCGFRPSKSDLHFCSGINGQRVGAGKFWKAVKIEVFFLVDSICLLKEEESTNFLEEKLWKLEKSSLWEFNMKITFLLFITFHQFLQLSEFLPSNFQNLLTSFILYFWQNSSRISIHLPEKNLETLKFYWIFCENFEIFLSSETQSKVEGELVYSLWPKS